MWRFEGLHECNEKNTANHLGLPKTVQSENKLSMKKCWMLFSLMPVMLSWSDGDRTVLHTGKYKDINNNDEDATVECRWKENIHRDEYGERSTMI